MRLHSDAGVGVVLNRIGVRRNAYMNQSEVARHYDCLAQLGDDPVHDPEVLRRYMDKWDGERFIESMGLGSDKKVLEIGVGSGRLAVRVAPHCRSLTGIDLSQRTIALAEENLSGFCNVRLICGDFCTYDFDGRYDVVYSSLTFMHIRDKRAAVGRAAALLTAGGRFVLSLDKSWDRIIDTGASKIRVYPDDPEEISSYMAAAGLVMIERYEMEFAHILVAGKK